MNKKFFRIAFFFLTTIALLGTLMRAFSLFDIQWEYKHLLHAHSHVAFQGWIHVLMMILLPEKFLTKEQIRQGKYPLLIRLVVPVLLGILTGFLLQGYGFVSILFSTLFQVINYLFIYRFFKDTRRRNKEISLKFVKAGLFLGLLSTFGPYAIGIISAKGLQGTEIYLSALFFFLHFQYNGWFFFVVAGLFFKLLEDKEIFYDFSSAKCFFQMFLWAAIPAYGLSLLGMSFREYVFPWALLAAVLQLYGGFCLVKLLRKISLSRLFPTNLPEKFFGIVLVAFLLKILLQFLSVFEVFKNLAFGSRPLIMAYMHLVLLGVISFFYVGYLLIDSMLNRGFLTKTGSILWLVGFVFTEILLVAEGLGAGTFPGGLFVFSLIMLLGVTLFFIETFRK